MSYLLLLSPLSRGIDSNLNLESIRLAIVTLSVIECKFDQTSEQQSSKKVLALQN